ncbi:MAG: indolepyruvate oxidoreductase subunit beta family protein [Xanthobacteraceae bacterium]|nr:MAG: indolepyruvate oxidoreductase subunit beta family protein [Xanthobacteraceae bacterium]
MTEVRPITVAILAMGGEGGGVLADWLVHAGEHADYVAQTTSVPGVAQRTGATIYYLELFPREAARRAGKAPVLALMPVPGDTDLVIASELMEAGRAIQRGLVTPGRTTLVASTHRVYSMQEKTALADGRVDAEALLQGCRLAARRFIGFDMIALAEKNHSVISAVLLGAIAGANALPFARADFEDAIRASDVSVETSLAAFAESFAAAQGTSVESRPSARQQRESAALAALRARVRELPGEDARAIVLAGLDRAWDYQDAAYAEDYFQRLTPFIGLAGNDSGELLAEVARQLALGMTYEDTIRVAELKIRGSRFERVRREVRVRPDQILKIAEFMHPRIEEIADTLPAALGRWLMRPHWVNALVRRLTARGRVVTTTSLPGFLQLYAVASLKRWRRGTLRFHNETTFLDTWLATVLEAAHVDAGLALRVAGLRNVVKGYGETHERGLAKYATILAAMRENGWRRHSGAEIDRLIEAANADESGAALDTAIATLTPEPVRAAS